MLKSYLFDYSDIYIVVKGVTTVTGTNSANRRNKKLNFKNNAQFIMIHIKMIMHIKNQ